MSISTTELGGQLAAEVYKQLLTIVRRDLRAAEPTPRQKWRFQPPVCSPALQAYWAELYKDEHTELEKDWAAPRSITPITSDTTNEAKDVSIQQAS